MAITRTSRSASAAAASARLHPSSATRSSRAVTCRAGTSSSPGIAPSLTGYAYLRTDSLEHPGRAPSSTGSSGPRLRPRMPRRCRCALSVSQGDDPGRAFRYDDHGAQGNGVRGLCRQFGVAAWPAALNRIVRGSRLRRRSCPSSDYFHTNLLGSDVQTLAGGRKAVAKLFAPSYAESCRGVIASFYNGDADNRGS